MNARKRRSRTFIKRAHDFLLPHGKNNHKPGMFTAAGAAFVVALLLAAQGVYLFHTQIVMTSTNFLASVLPGVLVSLTNSDREALNIPALTQDDALAKAAQAKADDMAARGYFSHVDPDGNQPWYWFSKAGYQYSKAGENLAVNFTDSGDVETAWMNSPTHKANIVKVDYTRIGIGVAQGTYKGKEATFVVQFFATPPETTAKTAPQSEVPTPRPVEKKVTAKETPTSVSEVLGARIAEAAGSAANVPTPTEVIKEAATSPNETMRIIYFLIGIIVAALLAVAIAVRFEVQHVEVLVSGVALLIVVGGLFVFTKHEAALVEVPTDNLSAAAFSALSP